MPSVSCCWTAPTASIGDIVEWEATRSITTANISKTPHHYDVDIPGLCVHLSPRQQLSLATALYIITCQSQLMNFFFLFPKERGGDERVPFTRGLLSLALSIARLDVY